MKAKRKKKVRTAHLRVNPLNDRGINAACRNLDTIAGKINSPTDTTCKRTLIEQWYKEVKIVTREIDKKWLK